MTIMMLLDGDVGVGVFNRFIPELIRAREDAGTEWSFSTMETAKALGAIFSLMLAAGQAYKVMVMQQGQLDILTIGKPLLFALLLSNWNVAVNVVSAPGRTVETVFRGKMEAKAEEVNAHFDQRRAAAENLSKRMWEMVGASQQAEKSENALEKTWDVIKTVWNAITTGFDSLMLLMSTYIVNVLIEFLVFIGELLWQIACYAMLLAKALMRTVLVIFGPVYVICALVPAWGSALTGWITKMVKVSLMGAMVYLAMTFSLFIVDFALTSDIEVINDFAASGSFSIITIWGSFCGTICQTFVAYLAGFFAIMQAPALAELAFPGEAIGNAAHSFAKGMTTPAAGALSFGTIGQ